MHSSVLEFLRRALPREEVSGAAVIEVGSRNVNGSPRQVVEPLKPAAYIGVDAVPGPGVDIVEDATKLHRLDLLSFGFDIVISTEMLEHAFDWRSAVASMKRVTSRLGGLLVITTRSPGFPLHEFPADYWRFTLEDFERIFRDFEILMLERDTQQGHPGVFLKARKPVRWAEACLSEIVVEGVDHG